MGNMERKVKEIVLWHNRTINRIRIRVDSVRTDKQIIWVWQHGNFSDLETNEKIRLTELMEEKPEKVKKLVGKNLNERNRRMV